MLTQRSVQCPNCLKELLIDDIVKGYFVEPIGMQLEPDNPHQSYFFFTHTIVGCNATLTIETMAFEPYIEEKIPDRINAGEMNCPGNCTRIDDMRMCTEICKWATYRRFLIDLYNNYFAHQLMKMHG